MVVIVSYDPDADATYVKVTDAAVASTDSVGDLVAVDLDADGDPVGIEVLKAPGAVSAGDEAAVLGRYPGLRTAFETLHRAIAQPA